MRFWTCVVAKRGGHTCFAFLLCLHCRFFLDDFSFWCCTSRAHLPLSGFFWCTCHSSDSEEPPRKKLMTHYQILQLRIELKLSLMRSFSGSGGQCSWPDIRQILTAAAVVRFPSPLFFLGIIGSPKTSVCLFTSAPYAMLTIYVTNGHLISWRFSEENCAIIRIIFGWKKIGHLHHHLCIGLSLLM